MSSRPPQGAASVILCRNPDDLEVFWVRRQDVLPFMGGFHAFPGGRLSKTDQTASYGLPDGSEEHRLRLCALRELYEETGVLMTLPASTGTPGIVADDGYAAALRETGSRPDIASLVPSGRWVTPPFNPMRFDTSFYLAWAPPGADPVVHDGELSHGEWIRPAAALDEWGGGRALLAPPTLYALRGLEGAALEASGNDLPVTLDGAAEHLMGAPEARGGPVTRIEMRPGLFLYPMRTRTLPPATHTNAFLIGGGSMVLIDPGSSDEAEIAALLSFIDRLGTEGRQVAEIWLTHHHPDHVGAVARVAAALKVPVRAHKVTAQRLEGMLPVEGSLEDGTVRELQGRPGWKLRVLHTPGHARGHIAIFEENSRSLIAGDMVAGVGFIVIDPPEGNMMEYLASLRRLAGLDASVIFPSHGPPTGGVTRRLNEYIEHRLEREGKVLAALSQTPRGVDDLLPQVYSDVEPAVLGLAARSLAAHLEKRVAEGLVGVDGDRFWRAGSGKG